MSKLVSPNRSPLGRAAFSIGGTSLLVGSTLAVMTFASTASAEDGFEDFEGNATTCEDAGLAGELLEARDPENPNEDIDHPAIEYTISEDGKYLNVTVLDPELAITGTVVKGGPAYRVYYGDPVPDMHAPELTNGSGGISIKTQDKIPEISHWFICGDVTEPTEPPTTPPTEPPTEPPTTPPTEPPTTPPTEPPTTPPTEPPTTPPTEPPTEEPTPSPTPTEPELPDTGGELSGWTLTGAVALLGFGAALMLYGRKTKGSAELS
ncbi:MAG TPA: LPXTG cell wall anchor domain-containing protein [Jiangellaceae bacterium]